MRRNAIETLLGGIVLLVAIIFMFFAFQSAQVSNVKGYEVNAIFYKIGGLSNGSDVRINGIKVGTVTQIRLNSETFDAEVKMSISPDILLPTDTVAIIASEGLVGNRYIRLNPGPAKEKIAVNGKISKTKDFRSLEDQVGEIIFLAGGGTKKSN